MSVKVGILLPLVAQAGKDADVAGFLDAGHAIVLQSEPETIHWFAIKYDNPAASNSTFAVFDTFTSEAGRQAHLAGQIPVALSANAATLLAPEPLDISQVEILASKVEKPANTTKTAGLTVGIRVVIEAKPEKVQTVREFLIGALDLVNQEPETPIWYAIHFPGTNKFGIIDFFANEAGRNAHFEGQVAAALFSSVDELLTGAPDVVKVDVLAVKL